MREAIGGTYLFQIVITFVFLFTAYLCLSINYARAFRVKDGVINIIEREKGYTPKAQEYIASYLQSVGYRTTGTCSNINGSDEYFAYDINGNQLGTNNTGVFCLRKVIVGAKTQELPERAYYQLQIFYRLDIPVLGDIFSFRANGDSYQIFNPLDSNIVDNNIDITYGGESEEGSAGGSTNPSNVVGMHGVVIMAAPIYNDSLSSQTGESVPAGTEFEILAESGAFWKFNYKGNEVWVLNNSLAINLTEYLAGYANFNIHAGSSYTSSGISLGLNNLYSASYKPVATYSFAQKLRDAAILAHSKGDTIEIWDAYRPVSASQTVVSKLSDMATHNSTIQNNINNCTSASNCVPCTSSTITGCTGRRSFGNSWFIASKRSMHNIACAVDVTLSGKTMPTNIGELSTAAVTRNAEALKLAGYMTTYNLTILESEWWHFQDNNCNNIYGHRDNPGSYQGAYFWG